MNAKTREILVNMKAELSSRGWAQGELDAANGGVCLYGALVCGAKLRPCEFDPYSPRVNGRNGFYEYRVRWATPEGEAITLIAKAVGVDAIDLGLWNDAEDRKIEDLMNVIDQLLTEDAEALESTEKSLVTA